MYFHLKGLLKLFMKGTKVLWLSELEKGVTWQPSRLKV